MGLPEGTQAMCPDHPDVPASSFCSSCGRSLCAMCARQSFGTILCPSCLAARQGAPAAAPAADIGDAASAPASGRRVLRPLGYADLFDEAFDLYKRHFVVLVGVFAVVNFPAFFLINLVNASQVMQSGSSLFAAPAAPPFGAPPASPDPTLLLVTAFAVFVSAFALVCAQGALTRGIADAYLEKPTSIKQCYAFILTRFLSFIWTTFLATIVSMVGMMLCCVGVFWGSFAAPCFVVEGARGMQSIRRSMFLAAGNWWRCLVVFIFASILVRIGLYIVVAPVQVVVSLLGTTSALGPLLVSLVAAVMHSLLQPVQLISSVLLYFDLRVRKEGFDIQLLAESIGAHHQILVSED